MKEALGLIETIGMVAAVKAADICVKSANVELIGYELTNGQGLVTVKIKGDVGAVKAAIEAAKITSVGDNKVVSSLVIPRPSRSIEGFVNSDSTVGIKKERAVEETREQHLPEMKIEQEKIEEKEVCNICGDVECPRRKGQPKNICIHYDEVTGDVDGTI